MKKYYYKLNTYYPYEGQSDAIVLTHNKKFSKEEIDNMIIESFLDKILNKRSEGMYNISHYFEGKYLDSDKEIEKTIKELDRKYYKEITFEEYKKYHATRWWTTFGHVEDDIYQIMIDKYGFEKIKFQDNIMIDSSKKVVDQEEIYDYDERDYNILKKIREKFLEKKNEKDSD